MSNLDQFMSEFNQLHEAMKHYMKRDDNFGALFYQLKDKQPIIKQYQEDIERARQLRNLLVHEKKDTFNIAEPTAEFIEALKTIRLQFESPATVSQFKREVISLNQQHSLIDVLALIEKYHVSQYPVFDNQKFLGLLTDNGITNWLASLKVKDNLNLASYKISDVMEKDEKGSSYITVKQDLPLYEIERKMIEAINQKGHSKLVILITASGEIRKKEDIIGIITPSDMPQIVGKL